IGNGVELMSLTGGGDASAEMALIVDSVQNASARIRFFRIAFGAAPTGQAFPRREVLKVLSDMAAGGRISYDWQCLGDASRADVRTCFLLFMCFETAMIHGGDITVIRDATHWTLTATADLLRFDDGLWNGLDGGTVVSTSPAQVQFALLPQVMQGTGDVLRIQRSDTSLVATFGPA
ncbi:histidine phosphotransferase family protein, partial [Loktanella sp. DJP18]|uniref:histidine phosphotransferase family protein n=1 Tax=Loktanella sp. DJP18 TaxID=3409788 RepID=UPI003BB7615B